MIVLVTVRDAARRRRAGVRLLDRAADGDPLPHQLRLEPLQRSCCAPATTTGSSASCWSASRSPSRCRSSCSGSSGCGSSPPRSSGAPGASACSSMAVIGVILPGRRPGDDDPDRDPAGRAVRALDRARDVLRAALARRPPDQGPGERAAVLCDRGPCRPGRPLPEDRAARPPGGDDRTRDAARDREAERRDAPRRHGRGAPRALPLPRLRPLHRGLDPDHELPAHARRTSDRWSSTTPRRRSGTALSISRRSSRRSSAPGAASAGTRSSAATATAPRRRSELHGVEVRLDARHHPQRAARGRAHPGRGRRPLPRPRGRRRRARRRGGLLPERGRSSRRSGPPARPASARSRTPARSSARNRCAARSTCSSRTASATASARSRTRRSSRSSPTAGSFST